MNTLITILINLLAGIIVMMLHEIPKNIAAYFLTHPVYRGGVKMNSPLKYIDVLGAVFFAFSGFVVGWQKPFSYDYRKFRMKEDGLVVLAVIGEVSSLFFAIILIPLLKIISFSGGIDSSFYLYLYAFVFALIKYNFAIFFVNLLPVIPMDMSLIVRGLSDKGYASLDKNDIYLKLFFIFFLSSGMITNIIAVLLKVLM